MNIYNFINSLTGRVVSEYINQDDVTYVTGNEILIKGEYPAIVIESFRTNHYEYMATTTITYIKYKEDIQLC